MVIQNQNDTEGKRKRHIEQNVPNRAIEWLVGSDIGPWAILGCMPPHYYPTHCNHRTFSSSIYLSCMVYFSSIMKTWSFIGWSCMHVPSLPHTYMPIGPIGRHKKSKHAKRRTQNTNNRRTRREKKKKKNVRRYMWSCIVLEMYCTLHEVQQAPPVVEQQSIGAHSLRQNNPHSPFLCVCVTRYGYDTMTIFRAKLYSVLLSRIPAYKILFTKRVSSTVQSSEGIKVHCEDGSTYNGDILVGADGGASPIRKAMYTEIKKRTKKGFNPRDYALPKLDQRCIVGVTEPLSVKDYPILASKECELILVMPRDTNCMVCNFFCIDIGRFWIVKNANSQ